MRTLLSPTDRNRLREVLDDARTWYLDAATRTLDRQEQLELQQMTIWAANLQRRLDKAIAIALEG